MSSEHGKSLNALVKLLVPFLVGVFLGGWLVYWPMNWENMEIQIKAAQRESVLLEQQNRMMRGE